MAFEISIEDKERDERLSTSARWRRIITGGPLSAGNKSFEIDLLGKQSLTVANRSAGRVAGRFVRLPSGDDFAWFEIQIDPTRSDWYGTFSAKRVVNVEKWGAPPWSVAIEIDTHVPLLVLRNRILIAAKLP